MTELHGKIGSPASGIRRGQLKMGSMERIQSNGPFTAVDELLEVKGIGKALLEKNRDRVVIN